MFAGNPVGDRAAKKITFVSVHAMLLRQRERKLNGKAGKASVLGQLPPCG